MASSRFLHALTTSPATGGMTKRYLMALGLVAALSLVAYLSLREIIAAQETAAAIINYSGKRRYSSQRAALYALRLATAPNSAERDEARREMLDSILIMENAHAGLLQGNPQLRLPGNPSPAIAAWYFSGQHPLDDLVRAYIARVRALADKPVSILSADDPDVRWIIITAPGELLSALDAVVGAYQRESESDIAHIQTLETMVLGATLFVLLLEAFLIFRPMVGRVQAERNKLLRAESFLRSVFDNTHDAILTIDRLGCIITANRAVESIFSRPRDSVIGLAFHELVHPPGTIDDWRPPTSGVHTLTTSDARGGNSAIDVSFNTAPIMTVSGAEEKMLIVIVRNSTEQLQRYARDLERRNHELDQFAYIASHDLKAPLRAIVNLATWIDEDAKDVISSEAKQHLVLLRTRVRRLEALIDGIHRYATATRPAPHPAPIDVAAMVRDIAEEHDASRRFVLDLPADLPVVVADRTRLWQVFSNLIANAIKHHHLGGGTIHVGWRDISDHHEFSVSDDGPGIPDRYHDKVFEIFQTLQSKDDKNGKDGLGLGLALVKKIVREEGGTISLHSEAGQGATFCFTWPKQMADSLVEVE